MWNWPIRMQMWSFSWPLNHAAARTSKECGNSVSLAVSCFPVIAYIMMVVVVVVGVGGGCGSFSVLRRFQLAFALSVDEISAVVSPWPSSQTNRNEQLCCFHLCCQVNCTVAARVRFKLPTLRLLGKNSTTAPPSTPTPPTLTGSYVSFHFPTLKCSFPHTESDTLNIQPAGHSCVALIFYLEM